MEIKIRPLVESDARHSVEWRNDPDIWRFTGSRPDNKITIEDELRWIRAVIQDITSKRFAITADDNYVGNIYLTGITDDEAEYHIFIGDKRYWGKGVAKEASTELIEFAKKELDIERIILRVNRNNISAVNLYEKLGFKHTGQDGEFDLMTLLLKES